MPYGANRLLLLLALALLCSSCYPELPADPLSTGDDDDSAGGDDDDSAGGDDDDSAGDDDDSAGDDDDDSAGDDDDDSAGDDDDSTPELIDADGDGADASVDCDDNDLSLNLDDVDADGWSTCDGDCDDGNADLFPYGSDDRCGWRDVSAGYLHTCAIDSNESIQCWGAGTGQSGTCGFDCGQASPPSGSFLQVATGRIHSCAINLAGGIQCWGTGLAISASPPVPPVGSSFTQISAGAYHTCAIDSVGSVQCWGAGMLTGPTAGHECADAPYAYPYNCGQAVPLGMPATSVNVGDFFSCTLDSSGIPVCWGGSYWDELDISHNVLDTFDSGSSHSCGIERNTHNIACWGYDWYGQAPALVPGPFHEVTAGGSHSCGIAASGIAQCWGYNQYGQAYSGPGTSYRQISAGYYHTCAIGSEGLMHCWGAGVNVPGSACDSWHCGQANPP